jgi:hypothetical protein
VHGLPDHALAARHLLLGARRLAVELERELRHVAHQEGEDLIQQVVRDLVDRRVLEDQLGVDNERENLGVEGATKTPARERVVSLGAAACDVATLCGLRDPREPLLAVAEDTLRDNFTKAQIALGIRHRSLYQAKHTYAVLSLLGGESPSIVARNLGISLATLEKHYAAALQKRPDDRPGEHRAGDRNATGGF